MTLFRAQREDGYVHGADEKTEDQGTGFVSGFSPTKYPSSNEKFQEEGTLESI